jgi:hypothetical protein
MTSAMLPRSGRLAGRLLACAVLAASASNAHAQSTPAAAPKPDQLIGSWLTTYQVAAFGGARPILLSFTRDGIVIETDTPQLTGTVVLSSGHGAWKETGKGTFAFTYRKAIFNPDASAAGLDKTNGTVTVSPDGTALQITLSIQFTDTAGNVTFSAPGTGTATRIVVDQND